ncbi:TetR family transcriptional regulator C-terminal domain-containing protein [Phycicoccus sp. MAQZ13P-2]|uniref:TetR/AcrR family transcriptional regulator n=1 Tax=Phycicoccus mangrovi TaxID=2840470 RepID=UPI001C006DA3|nr:TetR family transcriptional regulator C-terminal domain-containing protein [Phycicoccus mangrovi]MBT9253971.1 TetR family transcriptional regulator C-terminal domain-containing protein [Phycicoccus mangrovi]MBT9275616.1 TetR family transcriptional regulator C-terminal domain-containing protein [Phycicoccus mangrovi]
MPRVVDQEARRQLIADALLAVVRRDGIGAVSVRSVAAQAGLSVGSMRHTVASQDDLVAFAMRAVADRVGARVTARVGGWNAAHAPDLDDLVDLCGEVLPLDDERRAEAAVWLELVTLARTAPRLAEVSAQAHLGIRSLVDRVVAALLPAADPGRREVEAAGLHALLDGLALHVVLQPEATDLRGVRAVVRHHLAALAAG